MNIYFDSEFTGLHQHTTLISIGLIADNGQTFYAEFGDYDKLQVNEWIKDNVIDKLLFGHDDVGFTDSITNNNFTMRGYKELVKDYLSKWLAKFKDVQIISDVCHYDFVLFCELFGGAFGLPKNVSPTCHDLNQDIARFLGISDSEAFEVNREVFCGVSASKLDKHNALFDARVIKACHDKIYRMWIYE